MRNPIVEIVRTFAVLLLCLITPRIDVHAGSSPTLSVAAQGGKIVLSWSASAAGFALEQTGSVVSNSWQAVPTPAVREGDKMVATITPAQNVQFYRLRGTSLSGNFNLTSVSPTHGADEIGVTVHPQINFSRPVNVLTLNTNNFYATAAGFPLPATIVPAKDGSFAWLFFKSPMPGGTKIRVTVDGSDIIATNQLAMLDADGDGSPGGVMNFEFITVSQVPIPGTSLAGIVVDPGPDMIPRTADDRQPGPDGVLGTSDDVYRLPIQGVRVSILGQTEVQITGADGRFRFNAVPVGDVKVVVNGLTALQPPAGIYFPEMVLDAQMVLGQENWAMVSGSEVYLPRLSTAILQNINSSTTNLVKATPEGSQGLSAFQRNQLSVEVQPGSLVGSDGRVLDGGQVGISTVPPETVRDMLPPGILQHTFDITVQAPGVTRLSTPATMSFPNIFNAPPGTKLNFLSFDHTTGRLVIDGTATVSEDGTKVVTDPGTGMTRPGWHGLAPPGGPNDPPCPPAAPRDVVVTPVPLTVGMKDQFSAQDGDTFLLGFGNAAQKNKPAEDPCSPINIRATPLVIEFKVEGPASDFMEGLPTGPLLLYPGQQSSYRIKFKSLLSNPLIARESEQDVIFGAKVNIIGKVYGAEVPLFTHDLYIYRLVDIADLNQGDAILDFPDTLADGLGGVLRMRPFQLRMPTAIRPRLETTGTEFLIQEDSSQFVFDALNEEDTRIANVSVYTPSGGLAGGFQLRGKATPKNRIFVDKPGLVGLLKSIFEGSTATAGTNSRFLTRAEKQLIATDAQRLRVANDLESSVISKYSRLNAGVELADFPGPNTASVRWTVNTNDIHEYGYSKPGGLGDGIDNDRSIKGVLGLRDRLSKPARSFALAKSINTNFTTTVEGYPENILKEQEGPPLSLTHEQFVSALAKVAAHEVAHTFGAPHTAQADHVLERINEEQILNFGALGASDTVSLGFDGIATANLPRSASASDIQRALEGLVSIGSGNVIVRADRDNFFIQFVNEYRGVDVPPLELQAPPAADASIVSFTEGKTTKFYADAGGPVSGRSDIMSGGDLDIFDTLGFDASLSHEVLKMGLKLDWSPAEVQAALDSYIRAQASSVFDGAGDSGPRIEYPGPGLALMSTNGSLIDFTLDFGRVKADGLGGEKQVIPLQLLNFGDRDLVINRVSIEDSRGSFNFSAVPVDTLVPRGAFISLDFTCDPTVSGKLEALLRIESNDPTYLGYVTLKGFGWHPGPDVRMERSVSNLGGVALGKELRISSVGSVTNIGAQPLTITAIKSKFPHATIIGLPGSLPSQPMVLQPGEGFEFGLAFRPDHAGLTRVIIELTSNDPDTPTSSFSVPATGLAASGDPLDSLAYGTDFVALESPDFPIGPVLRAQSDAGGKFEFFLPPEQRYHGVIFDPVSGLVAHLYGITAPSGQNTQFGTPVFLPSTASDSDGDGLPDDAEFAIGTDPNDPDTDGNGIDDYTEIVQGRNPLGGSSASTGIIGRVRIEGSAQNVTVVAPDLGNPNVLHAYVSAGRLFIVDVSQPTLPVVLGTWPLTVVDTAVDTALRLAVVAVPVNAATTQTAVYLLDVSDPTAPRTVRSFDFLALEVEAAEGFAYTAMPGFPTTKLRSIDMVAQKAIGELDLPVQTLKCMTREANFLYVLGDRTLCIVSINSGKMTLRGTLPIAGATGRFSVVDGVAYVPVSGEIGNGGYATIDVGDPDAPRLIQQAMTPSTVSAPSGVAASTGSGPLLLGGLATGTGSTLDLMDARSATNTYQFVTRFPMPTLPLMVAPAAGYAFIAAHDQGLLVVNYLQFDTQGQAPEIRRVEILSDDPSSGTGVQVIEGHEFHVRVGLIDDVLVHSVELLVNEQVVQRSVSFPFNLSGIAPDLGPQTSNMVIQVRATDTGGNVSLSSPLVVEIIHDPVPPVLIDLDPAENERKGRGFRQSRMVFSKPMASSATALGNFQITRVNSTNVPLVSASLTDNDRKLELNFQRLEPGDYQFVAHANQIKDRAGNTLGTNDVVRRFSVDEFSIRWVRTNIGSWFQPTNWLPARVPGPEDSVLIDAPNHEAPVQIVGQLGWQAAGIPQPIFIRKLEANEPVMLYVVDLHAEEYVRVNNTLYSYFSGLSNTVWLATSNTIINGPQILARLRLHDVRMEGDFLMSDRGYAFSSSLGRPALDLREAFILNGSISAQFSYDVEKPTQLWITVPYGLTMSGSGTIHHAVLGFGGQESLSEPLPMSEEFIIGSGITLRGNQIISVAGHNTRVINRGRMIFDFPFNLDRRDPRSYLQQSSTNQFINENTIEVRNGARLDVNGPYYTRFINTGVFKASEEAYLYVSTPWSSRRTICDTGAVFDLDGNLMTASGQVSELSGNGRWLSGRNGQLTGGTVRLNQGAVLEGSITFNDVTFEGELHNYEPNLRKPELPPLFFGYLHRVVVRTNLILNGAIIFHRLPTDPAAAQIVWSGGRHRLEGSGRILFEQSASLSLFGGAGNELTLGPGITLEANGVVLGTDRRLESGPPAFIHNLGTILADRPGTSVQLGCFSFTNSGLLQIGSSQILTNQYNFVQTAAGRLGIGASGTQPGISQGQLMSSVGQVTLDGTVSLEPGPGFSPKLGDAFELLTFRTREGAFLSHLAPSPPLGSAWKTEYRLNSFRLTLAAGGAAAVGLGVETHGALHFDGNGDYTQIPHADILNAFPMTLMTWVRTDNNAARKDGLITKYADGSTTGYALFISEGRVRAWYDRDSFCATGQNEGFDGGLITDGQWHHIAFVVDQEGGRLYVDGELKVEEGWNGSPRIEAGLGGPTTSQAPLQFGRLDQFENGFEGDLDEVVLANASLSEADIQRWKDRRVSAADDRRIIGIWHFDENAGTSSADASGYENTATLVGDTSWTQSDVPVSIP